MYFDPPKHYKILETTISCFESKVLDINLCDQLKISCFEPKAMDIDLPNLLRNSDCLLWLKPSSFFMQIEDF